MIKVYGYYPSGNSYKVELTLAYLGLPYEFVHLDVLRGESRTPQFLDINPNGRIPVVEVAPGRYLAESHAILFYFGERSELMPRDRWERALVLQWMCFEQYHIEPHIGTARYHLQILGKRPEQCPLDLAGRQNEAKRALGILDKHLVDRKFMVSSRFTLADISLFAYTQVAPEGGIDLGPYPHLVAWHRRVEALPEHIKMTRPDLES